LVLFFGVGQLAEMQLFNFVCCCFSVQGGVQRAEFDKHSDLLGNLFNGEPLCHRTLDSCFAIPRALCFAGALNRAAKQTDIEASNDKWGQVRDQPKLVPAFLSSPDAQNLCVSRCCGLIPVLIFASSLVQWWLWRRWDLDADGTLTLQVRLLFTARWTALWLARRGLLRVGTGSAVAHSYVRLTQHLQC
jgi:hypothetical protein